MSDVYHSTNQFPFSDCSKSGTRRVHNQRLQVGNFTTKSSRNMENYSFVQSAPARRNSFKFYRIMQMLNSSNRPIGLVSTVLYMTSNLWYQLSLKIKVSDMVYASKCMMRVLWVDCHVCVKDFVKEDWKIRVHCITIGIRKRLTIQ